MPPLDPALTAGPAILYATGLDVLATYQTAHGDSHMLHNRRAHSPELESEQPCLI